MTTAENAIAEASVGTFFIANPDKIDVRPVSRVEVLFDGVTWTDVSQYVEGYDFDRGRNNEFDRIETANGSLSLDNRDGRFTPGKATSAYYPNILPRRRVRISILNSGVPTYIFNGYIEKWPVAIGQNVSTVTAVLVDDFARLAKSDMSASPVADIIRHGFTGGQTLFHYPLNEPYGATQAIGYSEFGPDYAPPLVITAGSANTGQTAYFDGDGPSGYPGLYALGEDDGGYLVTEQGIEKIGGGWFVTNVLTPTPHVMNTFSVYAVTATVNLGLASTMATGSEQFFPIVISDTANNKYLNMSVGFNSDSSLFKVNVSHTVGGFSELSIPTAGLGRNRTIVVGMVVEKLFVDVFVDGVKYRLADPGGTWPGNPLTTVQKITTGGRLAGNGAYRVSNVAMIRNVLRDGTSSPSTWADTAFSNLAALATENAVGSKAMTLQEAVSRTLSVFTGLTYSFANLSSQMTVSTVAADSPLLRLQAYAEATDSYFFCSRGPAGQPEVVFSGRAGRYRDSTSVPALTFKDSIGTSPDPGLVFDIDENRIANVVNQTTSDGRTITVKSPVSIVNYDPISVDQSTDVFLDSEIMDHGTWRLHLSDTPDIRCESLSFNVTAMSSLNSATFAALDIGSVVVLDELPSTAPYTTAEFFVEGISHSVAINGETEEWTSTLRISPTAGWYAFTLDDNTYGVLDTGPGFLVY